MTIEELIKELEKHPKAHEVKLQVVSMSAGASTYVNASSSLDEIRQHKHSISLSGVNDPNKISNTR